MTNLEKLKSRLKQFSDKEKAKLLQGFFKTKPGQYGAGDVFIGVVVPDQRKVVKEFYKEISIKDIAELLKSKIHEYRLVALLMLVKKYETTENETDKQKIFNLYIKNTKYINNWDLVDLSAPRIVGNYLFDKDRKILYTFAKSDHLWTKRIAMLSCFYFILKGESSDALKIAEILLHDKHDLIHKAVGWMLRELGKRVSEKEECDFLDKHYKKMPRTMLRYAIERFDEKKRQYYLKS